MPLRHDKAVLMISLSGDAAERRALERVPPFAERLASEHLAATWVATSPAEWPHRAAIAGAKPPHELALDAARTTARPQLGALLRREMQRARAAGLEVSSLFSADEQPAAHADLLAGCGITALCPREASAENAAAPRRRWLPTFGAAAPAGAQKLRWGLWQMPPAVSVATESVRQVRRTIDRAVAHSGLVHLHVDLSVVDTRTPAVEGMLSQIVDYYRAGDLAPQTVSETAASLTRPRVIVPSRSILRARAA